MTQILPGTVQAKPSRDKVPVKPVFAENIELVLKATVKVPSARPSVKTKIAATGVVGPTVANANKYAIIIGINDYPGTSSDLSYAVNDAEEVAYMLEHTYGFPHDNIVILADPTDPTDPVEHKGSRNQIYDTVNNLRVQSDPIDELVFYYSGHGAKGKADDGDRSSVDQCIVVHNDANTQFEYIWDGELKTLFEGFPADRIVFGFDSCLSGGMVVLKAAGRVVNMACSASGLSYEGSWGGGNGQFTYYFAIEGMQERKADWTTDGDTLVTVEEAFDYAKAKCVTQVPVIADAFDRDLLP